MGYCFRQLIGGDMKTQQAEIKRAGSSIVIIADGTTTIFDAGTDIYRGAELILEALGKTDVPVPKVQFLCMDASVVGTPFYVMAHVEGRIFRHPTVPEANGAAERAAIFEAMNDTLARIHRVDWEGLGLADYGKRRPALK